MRRPEGQREGRVAKEAKAKFTKAKADAKVAKAVIRPTRPPPREPRSPTGMLHRDRESDRRQCATPMTTARCGLCGRKEKCDAMTGQPRTTAWPPPS